MDNGIIEKPRTLINDPIYTREYIDRITDTIKRACPEDFVVTNIELILTDGEQTVAFAYARARAE